MFARLRPMDSLGLSGKAGFCARIEMPGEARRFTGLARYFPRPDRELTAYRSQGPSRRRRSNGSFAPSGNATTEEPWNMIGCKRITAASQSKAKPPSERSASAPNGYGSPAVCWRSPWASMRISTNGCNNSTRRSMPILEPHDHKSEIDGRWMGLRSRESVHSIEDFRKAVANDPLRRFQLGHGPRRRFEKSRLEPCGL